MAFPPRPRPARPARRLRNEQLHISVLSRTPQVDADAIDQHDVLRFHLIASEMMRVLGQPGHSLPERARAIPLHDREVRALDALHTARTAEPFAGYDQTPIVAGLERKQLFEHALAVFQPTLSIALAPRFEAEREIYDKLESMIQRLREELLQVLLLEQARPGALDLDRLPKNDEGQEEGEDDEQDDED